MSSFGVNRLLVWIWYKISKLRFLQLIMRSLRFVYFVCLFSLPLSVAIKRITAQIAIEIVDARNINAGYCSRIVW